MMRGRATRSAATAERSRWRVGLRGLATPCVVALVAAFMVGDGHAHDVSTVLASGPSGPVPVSPQTPPVTVAPDPSATGSDVRRAPASVSASDLPGLGQQAIPEPALIAYQRAAVVIDAAKQGCRLDWTLLAAIGQVESDNGQANGSHLTSDGIATPPIIGLRLDGKHGTSVVRDTDAGRLDGDRRFDRAVGPMQFLPSTWAAVAVDGDNDGKRNVQDINDAALGSAVYLCAGGGDLSTKAGAKAALLRYNHSPAYVARVLSLATSLRLHQVLAAPDPVPFSTRAVSSSGPDPTAGHHRHHNAGHQPRHHTPSTDHHGHTHPTSGPTHQPSTGPVTPPTIGPTNGPSAPPAGGPTTGPPTTPTSEPTGPVPPVIPDPVPADLAGLSAAEIEAIDAGWLACLGTLDDGWTFDQMQTCLADQLDVTVDDPDLATFLAWAVKESLVPAQDPSPTGP